MKLTEETKTAFSKVKIFRSYSFTRIVPYMVPIGFCRLEDEKSVWIEDNIIVKPLANLEENANAAI